MGGNLIVAVRLKIKRWNKWHPSYIKKVVYTFSIEILSATRSAESRRDIRGEPQKKTKN
jgi:hypothetical protein